MDILTDASTSGLCQAAEINLIEKSLSFCKINGTRLGGPNPHWFITGSSLAGYNGVVCASFEPSRVDQEIEEALKPFANRNLPMTWWTGPSSTPSNLGIRLQSHGFLHNRDMFGMAAEIDQLSAPADRNLPFLQLEEITSTSSMKEWMPLYIEGFKTPPAKLQASIEMLSSVSFQRDSDWRHYLVRQEERVIAIASLFLGGGVAGLYNLVTAPTERGKGVGAAFTLQLFQLTRQMGYRIATLQTTYPNALRLYHRLGFDVYCKFGVYQKLRHS